MLGWTAGFAALGLVTGAAGQSIDSLVEDNPQMQYEAALRREQMLRRWEASLRDGVDALGAHTPAGRRIVESLHFVEFLETEVPHVLKRWEERKAQLHPET